MPVRKKIRSGLTKRAHELSEELQQVLRDLKFEIFENHTRVRVFNEDDHYFYKSVEETMEHVYNCKKKIEIMRFWSDN